MKRLVNAFSVLLLSICLIHIPIHANQVINRILLTVNGVAITEQEINERCAMNHHSDAQQKPGPLANAVHALILEELLFQTAQKNGLNINSPELNQQTAQLIQAGAVPKELAKNTQKLKKQIIVAYSMQGLGTQLPIEVTEEEIAEQMQEVLPEKAVTIPPVRYYLEVLRIPRVSPQTSIWHRFLCCIKRLWPLSYAKSSTVQKSDGISSQALDQIVKQAKKGESFSQMAKTYPRWKAFEKWYTLDQLPNGYDRQHLLTLTAGSLAGPFEVKGEIHLVRLKKTEGLSIVKARHLLLKFRDGRDEQAMKDQLEHIRQTCIAGKASFADQVRQHSEEVETIFSGGDLGWIFPHSTFQAMEEASASLSPGQISKPFRGELGFHIAQVIDRQLLTQDNLLWKKYIAKKTAEQRKQVQMMQSICKELYESACIEWIDSELKALEPEIRNANIINQ